MSVVWESYILHTSCSKRTGNMLNRMDTTKRSQELLLTSRLLQQTVSNMHWLCRVATVCLTGPNTVNIYRSIPILYLTCKIKVMDEQTLFSKDKELSIQYCLPFSFELSQTFSSGVVQINKIHNKQGLLSLLKVIHLTLVQGLPFCLVSLKNVVVAKTRRRKRPK